MILRVKFNKKNYLKYIGHLDLLRLFQRTFKRADIPVKYSEGFNPHPRFSIANPLSVGVQGEEEYMDIELTEKIDPQDFKDRMNYILPQDIQILDSTYPEDTKSIAGSLSWANYEIIFDINKDINIEGINDIINSWLKEEEIIISRLRKKGKRKIMKEENIRPLIDKIEIVGKIEYEVTLQAMLKVGENGNLRPVDFIQALSSIDELGMDVDSVSITRKALYIEDRDKLFKPI
ncbi:MAG: TIGR03936 family radical SAM-associated protein [Tissierellaceae bacterium]|nr:TIGR03936 family radical SAM-associated protein [Tissierellaceae bacterium]